LLRLRVVASIGDHHDPRMERPGDPLRLRLGIRKIGILFPHQDENGLRDFAQAALGLPVARSGRKRASGS
jgi:hypothetical protein